jgi:hypothetical protein
MYEVDSIIRRGKKNGIGTHEDIVHDDDEFGE